MKLPLKVSQSKGWICVENSTPFRRLAPEGSVVPTSPTNTSSLARLSAQKVTEACTFGCGRTRTPNS